MPQRTAVSLLAAAILAALAPSTATASTWCYPDLAACPAGVSGTATGNVETAATTSRSDGAGDTIYLGAGSTYTDADSLTPSGSDTLTIHGAGTSSVLTTSSAGNIYVVNTQPGSGVVTLENLRVVVPASLPDNGGAGLQMLGDVLDGVDIDVQNNGSTGISAIDSNTIRNSHIHESGPSGSLGRGIDANDFNGGGTVLVENTQIDSPAFGIVNDAVNATIDVRRVTVTDPSQAGISAANGGDGSVRNSLVTMSGAGSALSASTSTAASSSLTADHVTVDRTAGTGSALNAFVASVNGNGSAGVTATNSIFHGFTTTWTRGAPTSATIGNATISIAYSDFVNAGTEQGDGTTTLGAGNINADPLFVSATDRHLTFGSPAVDAGDPVGSSLTDLDDAPRVVDGNADCAARRDMGAYELQTGACQGPVLGGSSGDLPYTKGAGFTAVDGAVTVTDPDSASMASAVVTLTDPQPGDELDYATTEGVPGVVGAAKDTVTLSSASKAAMAAALSAVTFRNTSADPPAAARTVTFRVSDGHADSNTLTRTIAIVDPPPSAPGGGGGDPGGGTTVAPDTTAPVLSGLVRRARTLRFTLSEPAAVTIRLGSRHAGRVVRGRCRKPTRATRRARACRRWVARSTARSVQPSGTRTAGLPRLAPGVWRATVAAADAAGNRSKAVAVVFRVLR